MADPTVLVREPGFAAGRVEVKVRDEHVLVGKGEELGGLEGGKVEVAEGAVVGCGEDLGGEEFGRDGQLRQRVLL